MRDETARRPARVGEARTRPLLRCSRDGVHESLRARAPSCQPTTSPLCSLDPLAPGGDRPEAGPRGSPMSCLAAALRGNIARLRNRNARVRSRERGTRDEAMRTQLSSTGLIIFKLRTQGLSARTIPSPRRLRRALRRSRRDRKRKRIARRYRAVCPAPRAGEWPPVAAARDGAFGPKDREPRCRRD